MNLRFRKVNENNPKDIDDFMELMDDLSERAYNRDIMIENIRKTNQEENKYLMVIEDVENSKLCASILGVTFDDFCGACQPVMIIENVVTHHDYRHLGIGRKMFEELEKWGKNQNVSYAILCSSLDRTGAHQFYETIGYEYVKGFKKFLSE